MLVDLKTLMNYAEEHNCGVGSFNTPTSEFLFGVIKEAEALNVPVIIMHAECHEDYAPLQDIGPLMVSAASRAKVPVCVHLDHGIHFDYIKQAIELGFTSVMIDASEHAYDKNVAMTKEVVDYAHARNVSVEAEIGVMGGREAGDWRTLKHEDMYTDPELAARFVKDTGIDALACSFGTAHGFYREKPVLDFERVKKIRSLVNIPLVMHGGSGVSLDDYLHSMEVGVRKFNYYSYMSRAGMLEAEKAINDRLPYYHELALRVQNGIRENIRWPLKLFNKIK